MLQDRLNKIKDYFQSIEQFDGKWVICVKYKSRWGAYPSDDGKINAVPDENTPDVWWYYGKDSNVDIDSIFDLIDETIQTNIDAVKKVELFKLKASELKQLFSDETLSFKKLQTLRFVFADEGTKTSTKNKTGRKKTMTKKDILKIDDTIVEETEVVDKVSTEKVIPSEPLELPAKPETVINATDLTQEEIDDLRG